MVEANKTVTTGGITFTHAELFAVVDDFYTRIQKDPLLKVPFQSVGDWPEHIRRLTHFWWVRFGGQPYELTNYNPVPKHFFAGFNRELLTRWLALFHETLKDHLNSDQVAIWTLITERMGEGLSMKNEHFARAYEEARNRNGRS